MNAKSIPELKGGQMLTLLYVAAFLIALFVVYKILGAVGIIKTKAKKQEEAEKKEATTVLRDADYFDPLYLTKFPSYKPIGSLAKGYAASIHQALGGWGTNEERIFTTFGRMNNKLNIAETALYYKKEYGGDMLTDILNDLKEAEIVTLWNTVKKLPEK